MATLLACYKYNSINQLIGVVLDNNGVFTMIQYGHINGDIMALVGQDLAWHVKH